MTFNKENETSDKLPDSVDENNVEKETDTNLSNSFPTIIIEEDLRDESKNNKIKYFIENNKDKPNK